MLPTRRIRERLRLTVAEVAQHAQVGVDVLRNFEADENSVAPQSRSRLRRVYLSMLRPEPAWVTHRRIRTERYQEAT